MIRILIITAVSGFILCAVCMSAAFAIGGRDFASGNWRWSDWELRIDEANDDVSITRSPDGKGGIFINGRRVEEDMGDYAAMYAGEEVTREFPWQGANEIDVGMPADVTYVQGAEPKVLVTGPAGAVDRFYIDDEDLRLRGWSSSNTFTGRPTRDNIEAAKPPRLKIVVTAPNVRKFDVSGTESLTIENYAQDTISIDGSGASKIVARGSARYAELDLSGAADADLSGLALEQAEVDMSGASTARLGPRGRLDLDASGASKVTLTQRVARLNVDGSGASLVYEEGAADPAPATTTAKTR